ncbi:MAG: iron permease [Hyphomicrobiales bacterium]|nr:iron permease [Hyphomicrobiales bacterium]
MSSQLGNVIFIIWRESVEALLVVGILNTWLQQQADPQARRTGHRWLWSGVGAGLLAAVLFGAAILFFSEQIDDEAQELYQTIAVLVAAVLIVQMVLWMKRNGRTLKRDLEGSLQRAADSSSWWGVFVLAMIAVAREGSETVIFLYGTLAAGSGGSVLMSSLAIALGFALAGATYALLQVGSRVLDWRTFFRITEIMLLFLAASLFVSGFDHLVSLGYINAPPGKLWDTSAILPDNGPIGGLIAALTGYRARPDVVEVAVMCVYWIGVYLLFARFAPAQVRKPA